MKQFLSIILTALSVSILLTGCRHDNYRTYEGGVWNTTFRIVYNSPVSLDDSIRAAMKRVELSLSPFNESSTISRINRGDSVPADSLVRRIFLASQEVNRASAGAFDPTVAPLINAWGFGYRNGSGTPSDEEIDSMLCLVGIADCRIDTLGYIIKKHPLTEFNFSAITKGFGCDAVAETLRRNGVTDYMIEIGGEIALSGLNPHHNQWRIMVERPDTALVRRGMTVITPGEGGVATSGNYRNFHVTDSATTWHTINSVTGRPAPAHILSATVIAPSAMMADALATSCMAMEPDSALKMIEALPDAHAMLILPDLTVVTTSSFPEK
ncbi:MAG: FAD:protein FMN transferase [Lachnoclostridium sp.]|nr:FAD:protein FMN transferase [Lachnoclostridium sp.]